MSYNDDGEEIDRSEEKVTKMDGDYECSKEIEKNEISKGPPTNPLVPDSRLMAAFLYL